MNATTFPAHQIERAASVLLGGLCGEQPRTFSGVAFNVNWDDRQLLVQAAWAKILRDGRAIPAPGCAHGWWLAAPEAR